MMEEKWMLGTTILWEREEGDVCLSVGLKGRLWRKRLMGGVTRWLWSFQQHSQMFGGMEKQPHPYTHKRQKDHQRRTLFPGIYFRNLIESNGKNILKGILFQISLSPRKDPQQIPKKRPKIKGKPSKGASAKYVIQNCTICFCVPFDLWFEKTFQIWDLKFLLLLQEAKRWFWGDFPGFFGPNSDFVLLSVWAVPKMATGLQGIFNLYTGQDIMENSSSFILRNFFFYCGDCTSSLFCRDCTSFSLMSPCFVAEMGFCRKVPSRGSGVAVPAMKQTRLPTLKLGNST